jgi:hypothetical protein
MIPQTSKAMTSPAMALSTKIKPIKYPNASRIIPISITNTIDRIWLDFICSHIVFNESLKFYFFAKVTFGASLSSGAVTSKNSEDLNPEIEATMLEGNI